MNGKKMIKLTTMICGIACLVGSALFAGQDSAPSGGKKEDKKMQILESKLAELKTKSGTEWLNVSKNGKDDFVQVEQSKENGQTNYTVTISYAFSGSPSNVLQKAGINTPAGWQVDPTATDNEQITYALSGQRADTIAEFVVNVFRRLFKTEPDSFVFSDKAE